MRTEIKTYTTADKMMMTGSMCGMMCMCCMGRFRVRKDILFYALIENVKQMFPRGSICFFALK